MYQKLMVENNLEMQITVSTFVTLFILMID